MHSAFGLCALLTKNTWFFVCYFLRNVGMIFFAFKHLYTHQTTSLGQSGRLAIGAQNAILKAYICFFWRW